MLPGTGLSADQNWTQRCPELCSFGLSAARNCVYLDSALSWSAFICTQCCPGQHSTSRYSYYWKILIFLCIVRIFYCRKLISRRAIALQVNCIACIVAKGTKLDSIICCNKLIIKFKCCSHILVHFVLDSSHLDSILSGKVYSKNANIFANWQKLAKSFYRVNKETIWEWIMQQFCQTKFLNVYIKRKGFFFLLNSVDPFIK